MSELQNSADDDYDDEFAVDPTLAASLGFSSFGTQPSAKKRKYGHNDNAFVDPSSSSSQNKPKAAQKDAGKGANALPLGRRKDTAIAASAMIEPLKAVISSPVIVEATSITTSSVNQGAPSLTSREVGIEAYRHGVKQSNGDMAYFLPSFLEDPWARLNQGKDSA